MKCHHVVNLFAASWPERNPLPRLRQNHQPPHAAASAEAEARQVYADGWRFGGGAGICGQIFAIFFETLRQNATGTTGYISCFFVLYNALFLLNVRQISK